MESLPNALRVSEEFVAGRHGIAWVGEDFMDRFGELVFSPRMSAKTWREYPLPRTMSTTEILRDLRPGKCSLGDLFVQMHQRSQWPWSLCLILDPDDQLRMVEWRLQDGEWYVDVRGPAHRWTEIYRVYGPGTRSCRRFLPGTGRITPSRGFDVLKD